MEGAHIPRTQLLCLYTQKEKKGLLSASADRGGATGVLLRELGPS